MDPKSLRLPATHEWVHLEGDIATVGITQFAVDQLTDLIMIELPAVGAKLTAGKSFGEIESVKAVSDLYAPSAARSSKSTAAVTANVQLLAEDPYDKGWLIKVKVDQPLNRRADGSRRLREQGRRRSSLIRPIISCRNWIQHFDGLHREYARRRARHAQGDRARSRSTSSST